MVSVFQYNDLRFIKIMSQRVNLCRYKKLPHDLKMVLSDAHKRFEDSAGQPDWDSEIERTRRDILLKIGELLVSSVDVSIKHKDVISLQQLLDQQQ